ncbi:helix-turn-helix domain-containing protein [Nocardia yamanashiensis]|uniref:helix-turn-helix domain-containing protein n=1 Tax=Nocardia yamanashiensis TaxID=209247 RepID=UPI0022B83F12|nr:helix-turn-helix domain-containing protein [Nocardia yamanashiensis]
MDHRTAEPARGLLDPQSGAGVYREAMIPAADDLTDIVAHHWSVRWDLIGRDPFVVEVLPSPAVVLVVDNGQCRIHGVLRGRFTDTLSGRGEIFGTTFRPAGFHALLGTPVADLTDRVLPAAEILGPTADHLAAPTDTETRRTTAEAFIRDRLPPDLAHTPLLNEIVDETRTNRSILRVDDLVHRSGIAKRHLQKLFREYIGVSPKWVIQRYRLHEAAQRLDEHPIDLATLAAELGYADQSHFTRDFKTMVGRSPTTYLRHE